MNKPSRLKLKIAASLGAVALAAGSYFLLTTKDGKTIPVPSYTATVVNDGDTFETAENEGVRLALLNAPVKGLCGYDQSKETLEKLIKNKPLYIKVLFHDKFGRLIGLVYTDGGLVNAKMVELGQAYYYKRETVPDEVVALMKQANDQARNAKRGIFGPQCTQTTNPKNPKCNIKGNRNFEEKHYLLPGCQAYETTGVQLYHGDQWFCSEKEALAAGFRKVTQCP